MRPRFAHIGFSGVHAYLTYKRTTNGIVHSSTQHQPVEFSCRKLDFILHLPLLHPRPLVVQRIPQTSVTPPSPSSTQATADHTVRRDSPHHGSQPYDIAAAAASPRLVPASKVSTPPRPPNTPPFHARHLKLPPDSMYCAPACTACNPQ